MLTDLVQIARIGRQKREENFRFRALPQESSALGSPLARFGEEIQAQIDCTKCANCCRVTETGITERDIEKLCKFLGVTREEFMRDYTMRAAEDNELILKRNENGCVFLKDNLCSVYEGPSAQLRELSASGSGRGLHCQPDVGRWWIGPIIVPSFITGWKR